MKVSERRQMARLSLRTPLRFRALRCTARVVHIRNEPYGDGRIGFGAEIEKFQAVPPRDRWAV